MICIIPKLNLRFGEIGLNDEHVSLKKTFVRDINLPGLTLVSPGATSDFRNSSL